VAYDTFVLPPLLPSSNCHGCASNWYTEGSSSTYLESASGVYIVDENNWFVTCTNSTETFCIDNAVDSNTCATGVEFCLVESATQAPYDYVGVLGLGLPGSSYADGANSSSFVE
jgi:hypothetical protein